jgi:tripartite-type tricarboxylate transporter receptor subunit TctC
MRLTRRNALGVIGSTLAMPRAALAAEWPTKVIRVLVPFPPGGAIDAIARLLGNSLSPMLGQAIVIENRPGAGGNIGAEAAAKAVGDGHTLLMVSIGHAVNRFLYERLTYCNFSGHCLTRDRVASAEG